MKLADLFSLSEKVEAEVGAGNLTRTRNTKTTKLPDLFAPLPSDSRRHNDSDNDSRRDNDEGSDSTPARPRAAAHRRRGFFHKMGRALSGVVYDVRHLRSIPGKNGPARLACACTRQGRWKYLLVLLLGFMLVGVFLSLLVNVSRGSRASAAALSGGGKIWPPAVGNSYQSTRTPPIVGADTGSFPLGVTV